MKKNQKTENANNENEKKNVKIKTFFHIKQHDQFCFNISKSKAVKRDRKTERANNKNECKNAKTKTFFHVK